MRNTYLMFEILLVLWLFNANKLECNESCWNDGNECHVKTELFKNVEFSNGLSMQIDCRVNLESDSEEHLKEDENDFRKSAEYLLLPRFMGVQSVTLDGCQTPLNAHTFGMELLPICANITKASITHFHMDTLKPLHCNETKAQLQLEYLIIQFNEIAVIDEKSFSQGNYPFLKDILIEKNVLKGIQKDAFKSITSLESLHVVNEPALMLKFPDLFEYTSIVTIHLESLQQMTSGIFNHLPETLQNLYVANTPLDNATVLFTNSLALRNLTIKNCALLNFTIRDVHSTVKRIDLSGNVMKTFTAYENNLEELNLSHNMLGWLPMSWLQNLTNLERLILKGNQIKRLPLDDLLKAVPNGQRFDFSQNSLQYLQGYDNGLRDAHLSQVRLKSDQNPWDCLWLHEFAHYHPETFLILQYEKFISKINVNGLECIPAERAIATEKVTKETAKVPVNRVVNATSYNLVYGNPWEYKRNQRAEALIIVFMLPLGIALLFMLLYMWIYCQKIFHLSYYQDLSCMRRSPNRSGQRFDIVRQIPARRNQADLGRPLAQIFNENEAGYEIPISGIMSECNCIMQHNDEIDKCQKSVHITYEHLPIDEPPSQMYEELVQRGENGPRIKSLSEMVNASENAPQ